MRRAQLMTCLLAALLAWSAAATAEEAQREGRLLHYSSVNHERFSLDEVVSNVRRDTGGRVLSAQKRDRVHGSDYRIKVLMPNATVRSFDVEARDREAH